MQHKSTMDLKQRQAAVMRALAYEELSMLDMQASTNIKAWALRNTLIHMCEADILKSQKYGNEYRYSIKRPDGMPTFTNISRIAMQRNSTWHRPGRVG